MRIAPISITIHLDLNYKPKDIWEFVFSPEYQDQIRPLHVFKYNEVSPTLDLEDFIKGFQCSVLKNNISIKLDQEEYKKSSNKICSTFKLKNQQKDRISNLAHFLNPKNGIDNNKLVLEWADPEPAVLFEVHYSKYEKYTTFYVSITISHGLWGNRCHWLKAMNNVILELQKNKNAWEFVREDKAYFDSLKQDLKSFTELEQEIWDYKKVRQFFWDLSRDIIKNFTSNEKNTYISPKYIYNTDRNFDIVTYRPDKIPPLPMEIPENIWFDLVWNECLSWSSPDSLKNSVKKYWIDFKEEDIFLQMIKPSLGGEKSSWQDIVDIIIKRPETDKMIDQLVNWTADINWPGAGEAWNHLIDNVGLRAIPVIEKKIALAKEIKDDWWEEILIELKKNIKEKYN